MTLASNESNPLSFRLNWHAALHTRCALRLAQTPSLENLRHATTPIREEVAFSNLKLSIGRYRVALC